jgi:hypothetical protein
MLTGVTGSDGNVSLSNIEMTASSKLEWYNSSTGRVSQYDGLGAVLNQLSFGDYVAASTSANAYNWNTASQRGMVLRVTGGGAGAGAVRLPALSALKETDVRIVISDPTSTQDVALRDHNNNNIGVTLTPGQSAICIADPDNSDWIVLGGLTAVVGP